MNAIPLPGVALITGASSGIGRETALAFAEAGAKAVVFADLDEAGAKRAAAESEATAKSPDFRALAICVDVTDQASVENMVDTAVKECGRIDYLVNSAGLLNSSFLQTSELSVEEFDALHAVNTRGLILCLRAVSAAMKTQQPLTITPPRSSTPRSLGRGAIVNLGSTASFLPAPGFLSYVATKHAVLGITRNAAVDLASDHIRVNVVCPSWVSTPMMARSMEQLPQLGAAVEAASPMRRAADADEVAGTILFLCSPAASYVNGTSLVVDGGMTLTPYVR